ncbi:MAG: hypothetical protein KA807_11065 [Prolixibacteraceae bacterium]|nr:hypothetical protein [Prolixibacteraceae bacterium]
MKIQTGIPNAGLYLVMIIIAALAIAYLIYHHRKDKDEFNSLQGYLLSGIRFLYILIISFLLLSPIAETIKKRIEKPILVIGVDNSESVNVDQKNGEEITKILGELTSESFRNYDIQTLSFGKEVRQSNNADFSDKISNYSDFIEEVDKRFYNLNVGAIVLIGDGIYNEGRNPLQYVERIQSPIYTIGVGDTTSFSDQAISEVSHNTNVFLGNSFPLEIEMNFENFNSLPAQLSVYLAGKMMYSEQIDVPQPDFYYSKTINLKSEKTGLQDVSIVLSPVPNEINTDNNYYRFTIEVHDNKFKVLFLTEAPHPDIGTISETLKRQSNFEVTTSEIANFKGNIKDYDLLVLNQIPSLKRQQNDLYTEISQSKVPLLVLVGPGTSLSSLNNMGLKFSMTSSTMSQESSANFNEMFTLFSIPSNIKNVSKVYPPLLSHYTQYEFSSEYSVLAYQKINGVDMNYPLIMTGDIAGRKIGAITGEGIWRWKLYEFQNYDNTESFDQLIVSMFNYLCIKEVKDQFKILYKRIAPEISPVRLKAQVYNEIYEPITTSEVKLTLTDSTNSELDYIFDANNIEYNLNLGFLKPGRYSFTASTKIGEKDFTQSGVFNIEEINIEKQNRRANFNLLNSISQKTGGKLFLKDNYKELISTLENNQKIKAKVHKEKNISEIIDWKLLMIIIVVLLTLEWFLRKFWGSY